MLQGINKLGRSWVGRVIVAVMFGFLIISFAIWGIGDIFRGNTRSQVATVGGVDISAETFRNAYQTEFQNLIRRTRQSITAEQARALGLEQRVLARLVSEATFDHETRRLGLSVSDELVVRTIQADPTFRGVSGSFDRARFVDVLRDSGLSEQQYVRDQRAVVARQLMAEGLTGALRVPLEMREAVHRYRTERRTAESIRLGAAALGEIAAPTDAQLQSFFDDRKGSFRAPEFRALTVLALDAASLAKPDAVTDEVARAEYGKLRDSRFGTPERRTIQQIVFPSKTEAEAAAERIKGGTPFATIATERGVDDATLNIGTFAKGEMLDPVVAEAAFALPADGVSAPLAGRFGPVIVRVTKIEQSSLKPYEEVAAELKREIAETRARGEMQAVHDAIEDQRASSKPLAEIARERALPLVQVAAVDRAGKDKAGQDVATIPSRDGVLAAAFRSDIGADNEAVATSDGGYVWFEVTGVEPGRERPLADVRDKVAEEWRRNEIGRGLTERARALAERIDKGEAPTAIAAELGLKLDTATDIARGQSKDGLTAPVVTRIFATPIGKAASAAADDETRVLFKVTAATIPPFITTTQESAATEGQLRSLVSDDLLAEYLADAEKRIGVTLYPGNVRRAIGGET